MARCRFSAQIVVGKDICAITKQIPKLWYCKVYLSLTAENTILPPYTSLTKYDLPMRLRLNGQEL